MNIAIFNVKYSPNLGDGIIALCLESELARRLPAASVRSIDLAGRVNWTPLPEGRSRAWRLAMLQLMPPPLRELVVSTLLGSVVRKRLAPQWRALLHDADCAVFGGGQLFQDGDLNFPIKLAAAAQECRRAELAMAIFAAGAAPSRSLKGRQLFSSLTKSPALAYSAARDARSRLALLEFGCPRVDLCRDPGLLAARLWQREQQGDRKQAVVGLGITHPAVLAHHGDNASSAAPHALRLYGEIALSLARSGYEVYCFTNGAAEDELMLSWLRTRLDGVRAGAGQIRVCARPATPQALARLISSCDAIVAHRLHAAIVAYAYAIPHVGLKWDGKLAAFFQSVERPDYVIPFDDHTPERTSVLVAEGMAEGIDPARHARVVEEAQSGISRLADFLAGAHAKRQNANRPHDALRIAAE